MTLAPGTRLGPYEITAQVGAGGMGEVYRAIDTNLKRAVAIKVLPASVAGDGERLARFQREAEVLAALNHPNIAAIYGLERSKVTTALVMELVEGPTLADRLKQGAIPLEDALAIARQIAEALDAAHERGIVHRDLKPANVKVRPDGMVKVLDFGLAKAMAAPSSGALPGEVDAATNSPTISLHATTAGVILGTAAYMSPEQASGKPVDKRTDIWAFGVVLWEMVTGRRMFEGETVSHVLAAVLTQEPDLSLAPARVRPLLERCLAKDAKRRLRDIGDAAILLSEPIARDQIERPRHRRSAVMGWLVAASVVALALALWSVLGVASDATDAPVVRLQIARQSVDPYNNAASAFALSPDGRFLALYVSGTDGRATLSIQTLASGERREVHGSAVQSPIPPFWSPDSRYIAHVTLRAASVFDVVTGTTRELCLCRFQGGSWNRDGVILLGSTPAEPGPIRRVSLDGRTPVAVTSLGSGNGDMDAAPAFLPDERRFLFTRTDANGATATYVGTLDGGVETRVADGARSLFVDRPGVGSHLLGIDAAGLVAQPLDLDTMTLRGEPVIVVAGAASASIAGSDLLAASTAATRPITVPTWFDRRGTRLGIVGPAGTIQGVAVSPDGRTIAVSDPFTGLWLRDDAGANRRLVERGDAPVWSPDGLRLLLTAVGRPRQIYERAADGTGQGRLLFSADRNAFANDWSRDAAWVIYTLPKGGVGGGLDLDLWAINAAPPNDSTPVSYLGGPTRDAQAEFSPDGRFVAYTSVTEGDPQVFVQPFPNASDGRWQVSTAGGSEPHWSPDGRELFYFAGQTLMVAPVRLQPTFSSGPPIPLFEAPVQPWYVNDTDRWQVARDGRRFLLLVPAGDTAAPPIDVVVNWATLLRRQR